MLKGLEDTILEPLYGPGEFALNGMHTPPVESHLLPAVETVQPIAFDPAHLDLSDLLVDVTMRKSFKTKSVLTLLHVIMGLMFLNSVSTCPFCGSLLESISFLFSTS